MRWSYDAEDIAHCFLEREPYELPEHFAECDPEAIEAGTDCVVTIYDEVTDADFPLQSVLNARPDAADAQVEAQLQAVLWCGGVDFEPVYAGCYWFVDDEC